MDWTVHILIWPFIAFFLVTSVFIIARCFASHDPTVDAACDASRLLFGEPKKRDKKEAA